MLLLILKVLKEVASREPSPRPLALILPREEHLGDTVQEGLSEPEGALDFYHRQDLPFSSSSCSLHPNKQHLASSLALRTSTPWCAILTGRRRFRTLSGNLSP